MRKRLSRILSASEQPRTQSLQLQKLPKQKEGILFSVNHEHCLRLHECSSRGGEHLQDFRAGEAFRGGHDPRAIARAGLHPLPQNG